MMITLNNEMYLCTDDKVITPLYAYKIKKENSEYTNLAKLIISLANDLAFYSNDKFTYVSYSYKLDINTLTTPNRSLKIFNNIKDYSNYDTVILDIDKFYLANQINFSDPSFINLLLKLINKNFDDIKISNDILLSAGSIINYSANNVLANIKFKIKDSNIRNLNYSNIQQYILESTKIDEKYKKLFLDLENTASFNKNTNKLFETIVLEYSYQFSFITAYNIIFHYLLNNALSYI